MAGHANIVELQRFRTPHYPCPYLPGRTASLHYRILVELGSGDYEHMLRRGWRRFGCEFFRPACPACDQCRSLRLPVAAFRPSRSQRRALKRNADVEVVVQEPTLTAEHLRLFNAYHRFMHREKGWPPHRHNPNSYARSFLMGNWEFAREFQYYRQGRLVGIGLADVTAESLSSIYFFHDPAWRAESPGVFSILQQLAHARRLGLRHHYLGYWVADSQSMAYKANYRPHEILTRYPADDEEPEWRAVSVPSVEDSARPKYSRTRPSAMSGK